MDWAPTLNWLTANAVGIAGVLMTGLATYYLWRQTRLLAEQHLPDIEIEASRAGPAVVVSLTIRNNDRVVWVIETLDIVRPRSAWLSLGGPTKERTWRLDSKLDGALAHSLRQANEPRSDWPAGVAFMQTGVSDVTGDWLSIRVSLRANDLRQSRFSRVCRLKIQQSATSKSA